MKSLKLTKPIIGIALLVMLALSCNVAVNYPYKNGASDGEIHNMINIQDLGVGFDIIYLDPEDLSENSVQGRQVKPRVFEFIEDPNPYHTIDIPKLGGSELSAQRMSLPLGVEATVSPKFDWEDQHHYIYSTSDLKNIHSNSFKGSIGIKDVASFSMSASFKNVRENTVDSKNMYVHKDGVYRGYSLEMTPGFTPTLTTGFMSAVTQLNDADPQSYQKFIRYWGTHYSTAITMGAKCSFRLRFNKETEGSFYDSETDLSTDITGGIEELELGFGATNKQESIDSAKTSTGASEINFVSYGGGGGGTSSFDSWSNEATLDPTLIGAGLMPYTELLNNTYFPRDSLINQKRERLELAIQNYHKTINNSIETKFGIDRHGSKDKFFAKEDAVFHVSLQSFTLMKAVNEQNYMHCEIVLNFINEFNEPILINGRPLGTLLYTTFGKGMFYTLTLVDDVSNNSVAKDMIFTVPKSVMNKLEDGKLFLKLTGEVKRYQPGPFNATETWQVMGLGGNIGKFNTDLNSLPKNHKTQLTTSIVKENNSNPGVDRFKVTMLVTRIK